VIVYVRAIQTIVGVKFDRLWHNILDWKASFKIVLIVFIHFQKRKLIYKPTVFNFCAPSFSVYSQWHMKPNNWFAFQKKHSCFGLDFVKIWKQTCMWKQFKGRIDHDIGLYKVLQEAKIIDKTLKCSFRCSKNIDAIPWFVTKKLKLLSGVSINKWKHGDN